MSQGASLIGSAVNANRDKRGRSGSPPTKSGTTAACQGRGGIGGKQGDPDNAAARPGSPLPSVPQSARNRRGCSRNRGAVVVVVLTVEQRSTTVPAHACRHRRRLAARQDLTIVRQIDDVAGRRYVFFNHGCSSRLHAAYRRQASRKRSAHRSNFTGGIGAEITYHRAASIPLYSATPTATSLRPA